MRQFVRSGLIASVVVALAPAATGLTIPQVRDEMKKKLRWRNYVNTVATDQYLKKFVADNKDVFNRTQVKVSHIVLNFKPGITPAEKEALRQKLLGIKREI